MTENNIKARKEAIERLRTVIKQGQEKLAHSTTAAPQMYSYHTIVEAANRKIQEMFETE